MSPVHRFRRRDARRTAELAKLLAALDQMAESRRPWQVREASTRFALGRARSV